MTQLTSAERQEAFATWPLAKIKKDLFSKPQNTGFENATEEDFQLLKARCEAHWSEKAGRLFFMNDKLASIAITLMSIFGTAWVYWVYVASKIIGDNAQILETLSAGILIGSVTSTMIHVVLRIIIANAAQSILDASRPLNIMFMACEEALKLMKTSQGAKAYRDHVLQAGREMRVIDLTLMKVLAQADINENYRVKENVACKELHGLSVS